MSETSSFPWQVLSQGTRPCPSTPGSRSPSNWWASLFFSLRHHRYVHFLHVNVLAHPCACRFPLQQNNFNFKGQHQGICVPLLTHQLLPKFWSQHDHLYHSCWSLPARQSTVSPHPESSAQLLPNLLTLAVRTSLWSTVVLWKAGTSRRIESWQYRKVVVCTGKV